MYKIVINCFIMILMFVLVIVFFGVMGFKKLSVVFFFKIDLFIVVVIMIYFGVSVEIIESKVIDKIEEVVMGIDGIKKVIFMSFKNVSIVVIEFELEKFNEEVLNDVMNKIFLVCFDDFNIKKSFINKFDIDS